MYNTCRIAEKPYSPCSSQCTLVVMHQCTYSHFTSHERAADMYVDSRCWCLWKAKTWLRRVLRCFQHKTILGRSSQEERLNSRDALTFVTWARCSDVLYEGAYMCYVHKTINLMSGEAAEWCASLEAL